MPDVNKSLPNMPTSHWYALRSQLKKSIPNTITGNYLASILGMTETSAKNNIMLPLKLIGLIDNDGRVNQEMAKKLRDDTQYPQLCKDILQSAFPEEMRHAFPDKDSSRDKIKTWIMNHTGVGDNGAGKIAAFYAALVEANPEPGQKASTKSDNGNRKAKAIKPQPNTSTRQEKAQINSNDKAAKDSPKLSATPDLNINIQIHISSDASPEQIKSIFENMAKYLYKD